MYYCHRCSSLHCLFLHYRTVLDLSRIAHMSLQDLPPEITERVVVLLSLSDISSLRLTNKCLALNTAQRHLKARFRTKRVELTEQRLRSFVAVTASGGLGCLLQDLTLVAPVYNTSELTARLKSKKADSAKLNDDGRCFGYRRRHLTEAELQQAKLDLGVLQERLAEQLDLQRHQRDVELLSQAFSNLATHGASLRMLRAEVEIYKDDTTTPLLPLFGGHDKPIWASADHLGSTLLASLAACNLPIQSLDLFNSSRMLRCTLSCSELNSFDFASVRLVSSLRQLSDLSLKVSDHHVIEDDTHQSLDEGLSEKHTQEPNFDGLRSLLRTCSSIRTLDLTHFAKVFVKRSNVRHGQILRALSDSRLQCLQCLTLQGFIVTEHELLTCLKGFGTLRSLTLRYIRLEDGSFEPVIDHCVIEAAMERVELDSLWETLKQGGESESKIVVFEPPWVVERSVQTTGNQRPALYPGSRASYRRASDNATGHQIQYSFHPRTLDGPSIKAWGQDMANRFGWVSERGKPSCLQPHVRPEHTWRYR
jgi:hypothetical protein